MSSAVLEIDSASFKLPRAAIVFKYVLRYCIPTHLLLALSA